MHPPLRPQRNNLCIGHGGHTLNYSQREGSFVTYLCFLIWIFGGRSGVREVRLINSTRPDSPSWRKSLPAGRSGRSGPIKTSRSPLRVCGLSQLGTEAWQYLRCPLLHPWSPHLTENSPSHKPDRMSPSGPFLLLPPPSSLWPPGFLAVTAANLSSKCARQQGQKPC